MTVNCQKCGLRPGTEIWAPDGAFGYVHGMSQQWCKLCVATEQLAYAKKLCAMIPEIEARIAELATETPD